ncbi:branched-chain alpha-ketoacid dehydrogenase kinase-like [Styela clava]
MAGTRLSHWSRNLARAQEKLCISQLRNKHEYSQEARERARAVAAYYNQSEIEHVAEQKSVRLTPWMILYSGDSHHLDKYLLKSAQYLHKELPVRVAHRIKSFHGLPFIMGCNPVILRVHDLYIQSFKQLHNFQAIKTAEDVKEYAVLLERLLDDHSTVIKDLATGFRQCHKHLNEEMLGAHMARKFLDRMLSSRLAIRMLAMHHILLHRKEEDHIGMIHTKFYPAKSIEKFTNFTTKMCEYEYGKAPKVRMCGHIQAHFPYIPIPFDYIICELLKNAMRFSVEHHSSSYGNGLPDIIVTIVNNHQDFIIKISDRGGGIPHEVIDKVLEYNFTTANETTNSESNPMGDMMSMANQGPNGNSKMHGHGFGLPMSRCYAEYMGGSLVVQSMQGYGTDVYLRLKRIDLQSESFRF